MAKTFTARGTDGLVAIHEEGANIDAPLTNLSSIYFHSSLQYLPLAKIVDVDVYTGNTGVVPLFEHGMGKPVMFLAVRRDNGDVIGGTTIVYSSNQRFTGFSMCVNQTHISAWVSRLGSAVGYNIPVRVYIFDVGL